MCCFTWATARGRNSCCLWFWQLVFGVSPWDATSNLPSFPNPLSNRSVLHDGRKHKTVFSSQPNALREEARRTNLRRISPFNDIERSLSRAVVIKIKSLPVSATTFPTALSLYIAQDGRKHKHNPTLSANKHVVQICRSSLRLPPMALQTVQVSVEPRLSTALKDRSVVPYSSPKDSARLRYMYHVASSVVFIHRAWTLAKGYSLSKLFSKAEPVPFEKELEFLQRVLCPSPNSPPYNFWRVLNAYKFTGSCFKYLKHGHKT